MKFWQSKKEKILEWEPIKYYKYLKLNQAYFPKRAFEIITSDWYIDPRDHKCPHDGNLISLELSEQVDDSKTSFIGKLDLRIRIKAAYGDYEINYIYKGIKRYNFNYPDFIYDQTHGDWLNDRFLISKEKCIIHKIIFSSNSIFEIECRHINIEFVESSDS